MATRIISAGVDTAPGWSSSAIRSRSDAIELGATKSVMDRPTTSDDEAAPSQVSPVGFM